MKTSKKPSTKREKQQQSSSSRKKPSAADFLSSPPHQPPQPPTTTRDDTPNGFNFNAVRSSPPETASDAGAGSFRRKSATAKVSAPPSRPTEAVSSLAELKELASSRLESIKRQMERSHSDIIKEVDSTNSRLHKRLKIQNQACQKLMDETDKEFKKIMERINEGCEAMKGSYAEFQAEAQTTHSRVCKTSIPEKVQFFEDAIKSFRNRYVTA